MRHDSSRLLMNENFNWSTIKILCVVNLVILGIVVAFIISPAESERRYWMSGKAEDWAHRQAIYFRFSPCRHTSSFYNE
jgi:hypothetical protein